MAHTRPFLRAHGLSDQQWRVLRVLGSGQSFETGRVAKEAFLLGPSLTGVLTRMERDGLIERQKDPAARWSVPRPKAWVWSISCPKTLPATTAVCNKPLARKNSKSCTCCSMN